MGMWTEAKFRNRAIDLPIMELTAPTRIDVYLGGRRIRPRGAVRNLR